MEWEEKEEVGEGKRRKNEGRKRCEEGMGGKEDEEVRRLTGGKGERGRTFTSNVVVRPELVINVEGDEIIFLELTYALGKKIFNVLSRPPSKVM